jgi:hypothetical protein
VVGHDGRILPMGAAQSAEKACAPGVNPGLDCRFGRLRGHPPATKSPQASVPQPTDAWHGWCADQVGLVPSRVSPDP